MASRVARSASELESACRSGWLPALSLSPLVEAGFGAVCTQPGVEIHAHYGATLMDDQPIFEFPAGKEIWLLVGSLAIAAVLLLAMERVLLRVGIGIAVLLGYVIAGYHQFHAVREAVRVAVMRPKSAEVKLLVGCAKFG